MTENFFMRCSKSSEFLMGVSYKKILPFTSTEMITVSGLVSRTKFFSLGKSTLMDVVTTGMVIKKMIKSTNITSTKGVVLISLMISSSFSEPMFIDMMGLLVNRDGSSQSNELLVARSQQHRMQVRAKCVHIFHDGLVAAHQPVVAQHRRHSHCGCHGSYFQLSDHT